MRFCCLSNLTMVFPIYVAYTYDAWFVVLALLVCMVLSMYYHLDETNDIGLLADIGGVIGLLATGIYTFLQATFLLTPINLLATIYMVAALYCYFAAGTDTTLEVYDEYHAAWHVLVSFAAAAYIYSHEHTQLLEHNPSRIAKPILVRAHGDHLDTELNLLMRELCRYGLKPQVTAPAARTPRSADGAAGAAGTARADRYVPPGSTRMAPLVTVGHCAS
jgi:hypothetical protein